MPKQPNPKPVKPRKAWAVVDPWGNIEDKTLEPTKEDCIYYNHGGCTGHDSKDIWKSKEQQGYRCVRVVIQEDK